jgi:hypothetical protein
MTKKKIIWLTRAEIAGDLGLSTSRISQLVVLGMPASGDRKQGAPLRFDRDRCRAWVRRMRAEKTDDVRDDVLIRDYSSQVEDLGDRARAIFETWLPISAVRAAWRQLVAFVAQETEPWPERFAARAAEVAPGEGWRLLEAEGPMRPRHIPPAWVDDPPPVVRPILESVYPRFAALVRHEEIFAVIDRVEEFPLPAMPSTLIEARSQWRETRATYRELRVRVRRGHVRREGLRRRIEAALILHRQSWQDRLWDGYMQLVGSIAGDYDAALRLATDIRKDALADLERFEIDPDRKATPVSSDAPKSIERVLQTRRKK